MRNGFHLAQANVARCRAPLDSPVMRDFVELLPAINALADASPGFVWRLQTEAGDATAIRVYDDPLVIFNMSVWTGLAELKQFVFQSSHLLLDGTNPAEVDHEVLAQARFWYPLLVEKKTLTEIRKDSELSSRVYEQWVKDDKYVYDRHYSFYHQWASKNFAEAWTKVAATRFSVAGKSPEVPLQPRVLAIWGTSDWLADKAGNAWIADVVNRVKPGNGRFVAMEFVDHFFLCTSGPEESHRLLQARKRNAAHGVPSPVH